jgi:hypothetical protein
VVVLFHLLLRKFFVFSRFFVSRLTKFNNLALQLNCTQYFQLRHPSVVNPSYGLHNFRALASSVSFDPFDRSFFSQEQYERLRLTSSQGRLIKVILPRVKAFDVLKSTPTKVSF